VGKRSAYERVPQDLYETPLSAVTALLPWLEPATRFVEPCVGRGALVGHLKRAGHICVDAYDLPDDARIMHYNALEYEDVVAITNPPFWGKPRDFTRVDRQRLRPSDILGAAAARLNGQLWIGSTGVTGAQSDPGREG
jgi:hypothetical protein